MQTIYDRLAIPREVLQTTNADKTRQNLMQIIEDGHVPIIFPDMGMLPYNGLGFDDGMWGAFPVICFGYEPEKDKVYLADRFLFF